MDQNGFEDCVTKMLSKMEDGSLQEVIDLAKSFGFTEREIVILVCIRYFLRTQVDVLKETVNRLDAIREYSEEIQALSGSNLQ